MQKRVFFSCFNLYKGGSLALYHRFCKHICSSTYIKALVADSMKCYPFKSLNVPSICYPLSYMNFIYRLLVEQLYVPVLALIFKSDHLVMMGNFPCFLWLSSQSVYFHNILYLDSRSSCGNLFFWIERNLFRFLIKSKQPKVFVQSSLVKSHFRASFPCARHVEVIGMPSLPHSASLVPREIMSDSLTLFFPSYPYPHKNHKILFNIYEYLREQSIVVYITAFERQFPRNINNHNILDVFKFLGPISLQETFNLYHQCDALIYPSLDESLGIPLIEASELSLPIIAPSLAYVDAAVENYYSYSPTDHRSLLVALEALKADLSIQKPRLPLSLLSISPSSFVAQLCQ